MILIYFEVKDCVTLTVIQKFDLKINKDHSDLYFIIQRFCISQRLLSYFQVMRQYDLKNNIGQYDLHFRVH